MTSNKLYKIRHKMNKHIIIIVDGFVKKYEMFSLERYFIPASFNEKFTITNTKGANSKAAINL